MMKKEMLMAMTVKELKAYVKENGIQVAKLHELKKNEIIEAILNWEMLDEMDTKEVEKEISKMEENLVPMPGAEKLEDLKKTKNNGWEKIAKKQLRGAYDMFVGGLENTLQDYAEDDEEYKNAYRTLCSDPEDLITEVYGMAVNCEYGPGYEGPWGSAPKEMKFAGRKFCEDFLNELIKKDGFCGYSEAYTLSTEEIIAEQEALDEAVAEISVDPFADRKNCIPQPKLGKYINSKMKNECPRCGNLMTNKDEFCGECGLHLYYGDDEEYDKMEASRKDVTLPHSVDGLILYKYGKDHKYCPICNNRVDWKDSFKFCLFCGQEVI